MRLFLLIVFATVNISCGKVNDFREQTTHNTLDVILDIRDTYLELIKGVQDDFGFVESDRCDSLLFSGLVSYSGGDVNLLSARNDESGQWHRTPYKDCYTNQRQDLPATRRSKSTISRDMLAGLLWGLHKSDLPALKRLIDYGRDHNWVMGEGPLDRTFLTHSFQDTLFRLAGSSYKGPPYLWVDPIKDHQRHVVALHIALRGSHEGKIDEDMLDLVKKFKDDSPRNALFSFIVHRYTDGEQQETIDILSAFPRDRLPNNGDWCGRWLWEKHEDHDSWQSCDAERTHSGGDFLFVAKLLEDSMLE